MEDFEIIDSHAHMARTLEDEVSHFVVPGRRPCNRYGTPEKAIEYMDRNGISKMVLLALPHRRHRGPLAAKPKLIGLPEVQRRNEERKIAEQVGPAMREINQWACSVGKRFPRLAPFVCISRELGDAKAIASEVELRAHQGAKGVKLHPGMFSHFPHDEDMWPAYEKCQELGLPIVADSGLWPPVHVLVEFTSLVVGSEQSAVIDYGEPKNWAGVLEAFPRLTVVLAHLGAAWWDERVELAQKYPNIYFDTAQGFAAADRPPLCPHRGLAEADAVRIFRKIGVQRILFGTDFPGIPPQEQLEQILRLPLTDEERRLVLADNAKRVLRL